MQVYFTLQAVFQDEEEDRDTSFVSENRFTVPPNTTKKLGKKYQANNTAEKAFCWKPY